MNFLLIRLLLLFVLYEECFCETSFEIPIPEKNECSFTSIIIDFCNSEHEECIKKKSSSAFCAARFCDCSQEQLPPDEQKCETFIKNHCGLKKANRPEQKELLLELPDAFKKLASEVGKECDLKFTDGNNLGFALHQQLVSNSQCAVKHKLDIDNAVVAMDEMTSKSLPIPFNRFRCGWQYGYIGKVILRNWIYTHCGSYTVNINHCCADHFNCYMDQSGKERCDENLQSCQSNVISKMISYKTSCKQLTEKLSQDFKANNEDYLIFEQTKVKTEIDTFNGKFHKALQLSETGTLDFTNIRIYRLRSDGLIDPAVRNILNKKIYKFGWSNRVIIDSCTLMLEECREQENVSGCIDKLQICLHDIDGKSDQLNMALKEFNQTVFSKLDNVVTKEFVEETMNKYNIWMILITIAEILLLEGGKQVFKWWAKCRNPIELSLSTSRSDARIPASSSEPFLSNASAQNRQLSGSVSYSASTDTVQCNRSDPRTAD